MKNIILLFLIACIQNSIAQEKGSLSGKITSEGITIMDADIKIIGTNLSTSSDSLGNYKIGNIRVGNHKIQVSYVGNKPLRKSISIKKNENTVVDLELESDKNSLDEVVVRDRKSVV